MYIGWSAGGSQTSQASLSITVLHLDTMPTGFVSINTTLPNLCGSAAGPWMMVSSREEKVLSVEVEVGVGVGLGPMVVLELGSNEGRDCQLRVGNNGG